MRPTEGIVASTSVIPFDHDLIAAFKRHSCESEARKLANAAVMMYFAGPAAERAVDTVGFDFHQWFDGRLQYPQADAGSDFWNACDAAKALYGDDTDQWIEFMREVAGWSNEVIRHPRMWAIVESLAGSLMKLDCIDGDAAWETMKKAWGSGDPMTELGNQWPSRLIS